MRYLLQNQTMTVAIDSMGAELTSVKRFGIEYIWQGDSTYWEEHSPIMFPICGRVWDGKYTYRGKTYEMGVHGFARGSEFTVTEQTDDSITFALTDNERTQEIYPFRFVFEVTYRLQSDSLRVTYTVQNPDEQVLYATVGAHPGINTPINGEGDFSDWYLAFDNPCSPDQLLLDGSYATGKKKGMTLLGGDRISLSHRLFDEEGIFMHRTDSTVTLRSDRSSHAVRLSFEGFPYFGIWQPAHTDAKFVCLEPWCGFAGYVGELEDISEKPDLFRIEPHGEVRVGYSMDFC